MTRIKNKNRIPLVVPKLDDYFVGSQQDNNGKTVNFDFNSVINTINQANGFSAISYRFSTEEDANTEEGYFNTNSDEVTFSAITNIVINTTDLNSSDVTQLLDNVVTNKDNVVLYLKDPATQDTYFYFKIISGTNTSDSFSITVERLSSLSIGALVDNTSYSLGFIAVPQSSNADWDEDDVSSPAHILNRPENTSDFNNDGEGSDRFVEDQELGEAAFSNNYADLDNKPINKVVENEYATMSEMYSNQNEQTETFIQYVSDASAHPDVTSGESYFEYLGTTNGDDTDYRLLTQSEVTELPTLLSSFIDDIGATASRVANTIFVHTVNGNDTTGELENRDKPFLTDAAAYAAIPDDGSVWDINFVDGDVTRDMSGSFPTLPFRIISTSAGTFDFTNCPNTATSHDLEIFIPNATFNNLSTGTALNFGNGSYVLQITCKNMNYSRDGVGFGGKVYGTTGSFVNVTGNASLGNRLIGFSTGTLTVGDTATHSSGSFVGNSGKNVTIKINTLHLTSNAGICEQNANNITFEVGNITSTGVVSLTIIRTYKPNTIINFDNSNIADDVNIIVTSNISTATNRTITIRGTLLNKGLTFNTRPVIAHTNFLILFDNFTGKIQTLPIACEADVTFIRCNIEVDSSLVNIGSHPTKLIKNMKFIGSNVIKQNSASPLIVGSALESTIVVEGTVSTNATTFGEYITVDYNTATFKEKLGEIVIRDKIDIVNRTLSPDLTYIIDGDLVLSAGDFIEIPAGGNITISGYGLEASKITKDVVGESIFSSPVSGSGGLQMQGLSFSSGAGSVFDLVDEDGTNAIEVNVCNFKGCSSLGEINDYRQFLGTTIGIYGCSDGLTLSGTWNGFKLTNTNVFGFGSSGTLFKAGTGLTFSNRFFIEVNVDLPTGGVLADFSDSNFLDNELFQINSSIAKLNSTINIDNAAALIPNMSANSVRSLWVGNIGLPDSATEAYLEDATVTGTFDINWLRDTYFLTMIGDTTFTESNLPASSKNTQEIKVYLTGEFVPTFPANWETNMVGTYKGADTNELTIKFIKSGVYFVKIANTLTPYPAPRLGTVEPPSLVPLATAALKLNGSFFTPESVVLIDGQVVNSIDFNDDTGALDLSVTAGATEEDVDIFISNGTGVTFTQALTISLGDVFLPTPTDWVATSGSVDFIGNGLYGTVFDSAGTGIWDKELDITKDWELRFKLKRTPLGSVTPQSYLFWFVELLRVSDDYAALQIWQDMPSGTYVQHKVRINGSGNVIVKSWNSPPTSSTNTFINEVEPAVLKITHDAADNSLKYYVDQTLSATFSLTATENYRPRFNVRRMDITDIKYIELP